MKLLPFFEVSKKIQKRLVLRVHLCLLFFFVFFDNAAYKFSKPKCQEYGCTFQNLRLKMAPRSAGAFCVLLKGLGNRC
jgi:hypothetical protein